MVSTTKKMQAVMQDMFGKDISITMARCPAFGNDDICILINGKNHEMAAASLIAPFGNGSVEVMTGGGWDRCPEYTYSKFTASAKVEA